MADVVIYVALMLGEVVDFHHTPPEWTWTCRLCTTAGTTPNGKAAKWEAVHHLQFAHTACAPEAAEIAVSR